MHKRILTKIKAIEFHSLHIVVALVIGTILGSIGVGLLVQSNPLLLGMDAYFYELIHYGNKHQILDWLIRPFNYNFLPAEFSPGRMPSYYYFMIGFTLIYLGIFKRSLFGYALFCFFAGTLLAYYITDLDWKFVFRQRPFLTLPSNVDEIGRSAWSQLSSYPSGHARETTLYATIISAFIPRMKILLILFVVFILYSRVYVGAHFPTDVLAGSLIGFLTAKTVLIISREIQLILANRKEDKHGRKPKGADTDLIPS